MRCRGNDRRDFDAQLRQQYVRCVMAAESGELWRRFCASHPQYPGKLLTCSLTKQMFAAEKPRH